MPKVPHAGIDHGYAKLIGGARHFVVAHAAARLDDAGGARIDHHIEPITKREEGVAGDDRASHPPDAGKSWRSV